MSLLDPPFSARLVGLCVPAVTVSRAGRGDRLIGRRLSGNTPTLLVLISLILRFKIQT